MGLSWPMQARAVSKRAAKNVHVSLLAWRSQYDQRLVHDGSLKWLFVLTFPNGGSTAFAMLLNTSKSCIAVNRNAEGQGLVPEWHHPSRKWDKNYHPDYRAVRALWIHEARRRKTGPCVVVEKSPPNMCRFRHIRAAFSSMPTRVIRLTRDPYATCASMHKRRGRRALFGSTPPHHPASTTSSRESYFERLGVQWGERAQMLVELEAECDLTFSYEEFADAPTRTLARVGALLPEFKDIDPIAGVKVKDYPKQGIRNMNQEQIASLTSAEIALITRGLAPYEDAVHALGYRLR